LLERVLTMMAGPVRSGRDRVGSGGRAIADPEQVARGRAGWVIAELE